MGWFGNKVDKDSLERSISRDEELIRELKSGNAWWFNPNTDDYDVDIDDYDDVSEGNLKADNMIVSYFTEEEKAFLLELFREKND